MLARASTNATNHSLPIDSTVKDGLSLFCILSPIASILSLDCHLKSRTHFFKLEWYLKGSAALFFFRSDKNNLVFDPSLQWNFYVRGSGHIFYRKKGRLLEPLSVQWKERKSGNFQRMMAFISLAIAITFSFEESFFMTASVAIPSKRVRSEEGEKTTTVLSESFVPNNVDFTFIGTKPPDDQPKKFLSHVVSGLLVCAKKEGIRKVCWWETDGGGKV